MGERKEAQVERRTESELERLGQREKGKEKRERKKERELERKGEKRWVTEEERGGMIEKAIFIHIVEVRAGEDNE